MGLLVFESGENKNKRIRLENFPITVGRDPRNTVCIDDKEVSRFHFRIKQRGRLYIVEDLESRNGTYVNGDRVLNSLLKNGDTILLGNTHLCFATNSPDIILSEEVSQFDMKIIEEKSLPEVLNIDGNVHSGGFTPVRFKLEPLIAQAGGNNEGKARIYEHLENILAVDQIDESGQRLLKSIGLLSPHAAKSALFVYSDSNRQLIPIASRHHKENTGDFLLSRRSFEDALARKQGVRLANDNPNTTAHSQNRIVLPIETLGRIAFVLHIEYDASIKEYPSEELGLITSLSTKCAPFIENMLLRSEIDRWMIGMVETMVAAIEAKDTYTLGHSERVCKYALAIAEELKINKETKKLLMVSSICHDIGKIGVPDAILKKAAMLSAEEYQEIQLHPVIGADIIAKMPNAKKIISGVKYHHEKWDGTGYPDGLEGEEIPFFARIVAIADVFDAMVSGRSYSGFLDESDAVQKLNEEAELFDPEILKAFNKAWDNGILTLKTSTMSKKEEES